MTVLIISHRILNPIAAVKELLATYRFIKCKNHLEILLFELFIAFISLVELVGVKVWGYVQGWVTVDWDASLLLLTWNM